MSIFEYIKKLLSEESVDEDKLTEPEEEVKNGTQFSIRELEHHNLTQYVSGNQVSIAGEMDSPEGITINKTEEPVTLKYKIYTNTNKEEILTEDFITTDTNIQIKNQHTTITNIIEFYYNEECVFEYRIGDGSDSFTVNDTEITVSDLMDVYVEPYMGKYGRSSIENEQREEDPSIQIGYTQTNIGEVEPAEIPLSELYTHMYTSGLTGTGKSTMLINMMLQFSKLNKNFIFMTPKSDDTLTLLQTLDEDELEKTDILKGGGVETENIVGYNLFDTSDMTEIEKRKFTEDKVDTFVAMMVSKFGTGALLEPVARSVGKSMIKSEKNYTMADFVQVIMDDDYRETFVSDIKQELENPPSYLDTLNEFSADDELDSLSRRVKQFEEKDALKQLTFTEESDISFTDYIEGDRNLIVDLELLGEDEKSLVGIMVVRELWVAAKRRGEKIPEKNRDLSIAVIDEVQDIITEENFEDSNIGTILEKARSYRLSLITASQSPNQINRGFQNELKNNTNIKLPLRTENIGDFYDNTFSKVGGKTVTRDDIGKLNDYKSYLQINPNKIPKKVNNYPVYPPKLTEIQVMDVKENIIERTGSQRIPEKPLDDLSLLGGSSDTTGEKEKTELKWKVCRSIDIAQRYESDIKSEKAEYVTVDSVKQVLDAMNINYGEYNDLDQFINQNNYLFNQKDTSEGFLIGLSPEGEKLAQRQDSGSSSSAGKKEHRQLLRDIRNDLANVGVAVEIPQQEGEQADAIGHRIEDDLGEAVEKLFGDVTPNTTYIEAEHSTSGSKPAQTIKNLFKNMRKGNKVVFAMREESEAKKNEERILQDGGYRQIYNNGEKKLYNNNTVLKEKSARGMRYPLRPRNDTTRTTIWIKRGDKYVLKDNEQNEHAHLTMEELGADDWNAKDDFPAYYYKEGGNYIVIQDGDTVGKYSSKEDMKKEWMTIKDPVVPDYEFDNTGNPTLNDMTHLVIGYENEDPYIYEQGTKYHIFTGKIENNENNSKTSEIFEDDLVEDEEEKDNSDEIRNRLDW